MMNPYQAAISSIVDLRLTESGFICTAEGLIALDIETDCCSIDEDTAKVLELVQNNIDDSNRKHSLLGYLNTFTATTAGTSFLRERILRPFTNFEVIEWRLNCIDYLVSRVDVLSSISNCIRKLGAGVDLDAVIPCLLSLTKARNSSLQIAERRLDALETLGTLLSQVTPLVNALEFADQPTLNMYRMHLLDPAYDDILNEISSKIENDALTSRNKKKKLLRIKHGIDGLFDIARQTYIVAIQDLEELTRELKRDDGIPWKLNYNETRGYFLTVGTNQIKKDKQLGPEYIGVNKTRTLISCTTKGIMQLNNRAKLSYQNSMRLASDMLIDILKFTTDRVEPIRKLICVVGVLDLITSFAKLANDSNGALVRPRFTSTETILTKSRHPVLETVLKDNSIPVVPNDVMLSTQHQNFMLVTGPNMGGKSILLKQIGITQIMAQLGCYVPAEEAHIKIMDRIIARSGSDDDNNSNCSSFMWEMKGIASALKGNDQSLNQSVLYLIDEVGRGTSVDDGASYSFAIAEEMALRKHCFTVFATHFDQVFALTTLYNNVSAYHFRYEAIEDDGDKRSKKRLRITHILAPGLGESDNYGIRLAQACGLPKEILKVAKAGLGI